MSFQTAQWIGDGKRKTTGRQASPFLRKSFLLPEPVRRATQHWTALGIAELHLNGQKVGRDFLMPGWSDYRKRVQVLSTDVTKLLRARPQPVWRHSRRRLVLRLPPLEERPQLLWQAPATPRLAGNRADQRPPNLHSHRPHLGTPQRPHPLSRSLRRGKLRRPSGNFGLVQTKPPRPAAGGG